MQIAMKFFLQFSIFLLCCGKGCCFADDHASEEITAPSPAITEDQGKPDDSKGSTTSPYADHPGIHDEMFHHAERESDTFQAKFLNMLFLLALLIGFMILASWALKRLMKTKISQLNTASNIKVLETRYLSPRATLYLIEIQDQAILIAESPTAVSCVATFPQEREPFAATAKTSAPK